MSTRFIITSGEAEKVNWFFQYIEMRLTEEICKLIWNEREETAYPLYKHMYAKFNSCRYSKSSGSFGQELYHYDVNHFFNSLDPHNKQKLVNWYNEQMNGINVNQ